MLKISRQQLINRRDSLPDNLREALFSEYNAETLWKICEGQHLSKDKIYIIATLAGDVILGFLHPEDLSSEIKKELGLVPELANLIASEIDRKIFTSIRSEIEKVYAPVSEGEGEAGEPRDEIASPLARNDREGEAESISIPISMFSRDSDRSIGGVEIRKPESPIRIIGEEEISQPSILSAESSKLEPSAEIKPEFSAASQEGPIIIHEETEFKPLSESKKPLKSLSGLFGFLRKKDGLEEAKPVRAEVSGIEDIQLILNRESADIQSQKEKSTKIKVVNYIEAPDVLEQLTTDNKQLTTEEPKPLVVSPSTELRAGEVEPPIRIIEEMKSEKIIASEIIPTEEIIHEEIKPEPTIKIETKKSFLNDLFGFFKKKKETADIQVIEKNPLLKEENNNENIELFKEESPIKIVDEKNEAEAPKIPSLREVSRREIITELPIAELPSDNPAIILKEIEPKPKNKFLSGLFGFFRKKKK